MLSDNALYHEGKKPLFSLKMKLVSSIFTSDFHMGECMMAIQNEEKMVKGDVVQVRKKEKEKKRKREKEKKRKRKRLSSCV